MKVRTASGRILGAVFCVLVIANLLVCAPRQAFRAESDTALRLSLEKAASYPKINFVSISDLHIYDANLGTTGKAFEDYLTADRKLLRESPEILEAAISSINGLDASFVLCPGDLTKDGEKQSHLLAAQYLDKLKTGGKKVFVVPGNHDIKNGHSYRYSGDLKERVPNITAEEFIQIYGDYGFKDALERDSDSLSYVAEPVPGLWLLALDSCCYKENVEDQAPVTDGKFSQATLAWIEDMLVKSVQYNKAVIAMMHHGALEHYAGQQKNYGEYIVDDFDYVSRLFAVYNVRLVFTGHYHAQDITVRTFPQDKKFVFDIETGSLVTYPCPYRVIKIDDNQHAAISTWMVTSIKSRPQDFPQYAKDYLEKGIAGIAAWTIMGYKVDETEAQKLAVQVADAFVAHYGGNENLASGKAAIQEDGLSLMGWIVIQMRKDLVYGLWQDLPPPDLNVTLDLSTGSWK